MEIRAITADEWPEFARADNTAFGFHPTDEVLDPANVAWPLDRSVATFDGDRIVGTAGAYSFELTLPGLAQTPAAGVTWVGVLPTHRRRGVLSGMMRHQLEDVARRGEAVAVLLASESVIYGRYGYGLATHCATWAIDRRHAAFARPVESPGTLRFVDADEAKGVFPLVHDEARQLTPGDVDRPDGWWGGFFRRREGGDRFFVVYEAGGRAEGYTSYKITGGTDGFRGRTVKVQDVIATTDEAYVALWRFLTDLDLTERVEAAYRPLDEPLRHLLADPRRLEGKVGDYLWVRLVDLPKALAARGYAIEGRLVLEVADAVRPANSGRWALETGPDGASCTRTTEEPDLSLGVAELGAAYLGGTRLATLARAGRVLEHQPGAAASADLVFASDPAPWCSTFF